MKLFHITAGGVLLTAGLLFAQEVKMTIPPPPGLQKEASPSRAKPDVDPEPARDDRIQAPPVHPEKGVGSEENPVSFDGSGVGGFLSSYQRAKANTNPDWKSLDEDLKTILPPGVYQFRGDCALERIPGERIHKNQWILNYAPLCLKLNDRKSFPVAVVANDRDFIKRFLRDAGPGRRVEVTARLRDRGVDSGGYFTVWEILSASFQNPYLAYLGRQFPEFTESELVQAEPVSLALPGILPIAAKAATDRDSTRVYELELVLKKGDFYHFDRNCPLVLTDDVRLDSVTSHWNLQARISCIQDSRLSIVDLQLPEEIFRFYPRLPVRKGLRMTARLKFRGIVSNADQFYLLWDTIKDIGDP